MNFKAAFVFRERRQLEAWTRTQRNVFSSFLCAEYLRSVRVCGLPPDFVQRKQRTLSPSALNNNPREFVLLPRRSFLSHSSSVSNTLARLETELVFVFFMNGNRTRRSSCSGCLPKRWSLLPRGKGKAICCPALLPASSVCFLLASWPFFLCLIAPSLLFLPSASVCFLLASCLLLTLFSLFFCPSLLFLPSCLHISLLFGLFIPLALLLACSLHPVRFLVREVGVLAAEGECVRKK